MTIRFYCYFDFEPKNKFLWNKQKNLKKKTSFFPLLAFFTNNIFFLLFRKKRDKVVKYKNEIRKCVDMIYIVE